MILGLTGTNGAGKGAVVDYLVKEKGFAHFPVRDLILEEMRKRGVEPDRTSIGETANDMRRIYGAGYFSEYYISKAKENGLEDIIIESIRTVAEADNIKRHGGFMVAIDAPIDLRYDRVIIRGSHTDKVTLEEFIHQEMREYVSADPTNPILMNFKQIMEDADYTLVNDGTFEELGAKIDAMLAELATR